MDLLELFLQAGIISSGEHKRANEARSFAGRSLHMGQILIMLNLITPNELKFALETLNSITEGRMTPGEAVNVLRKYHDRYRN